MTAMWTNLNKKKSLQYEGDYDNNRTKQYLNKVVTVVSARCFLFLKEWGMGEVVYYYKTDQLATSDDVLSQFFIKSNND